MAPSGNSVEAGQEGQTPVEAVRRLLHRRLKVGVSDGRVFVGRFHCLDKQGNLILFDTHEFVPRRHFPPQPARHPNGEARSPQPAPDAPLETQQTREASTGPHSRVADANAPQEEAGHGSPPSNSPRCLETPREVANSGSPSVVGGHSSYVRARDSQGDGSPRQNPQNGPAESSEDALQGDGATTSRPFLHDITQADCSAELSADRESSASLDGGGQRPATSERGDVQAAEDRRAITSPEGKASGSIASLLPAAPAHAVSIQPGAEQQQQQQQQGSMRRREEGQEPELVEQRHLGLVLIPVHARVSCQLDCELDEDLSFLSLSDD